MSLRRALPPALVAVLSLSALLTPASARAERPNSPRATVDYSFVSMPDFLNADIGDVSGEPGWDPGDPNSINGAYRNALDVILNDVAAESGSDVLVAGDMVEGHWGFDDTGYGIFGPVASSSERTAALRRAADVYYPQWAQRFSSRGLNVLPAVGDHEIGDNPWQPKAYDPGRASWYQWKRDQMHVFKNKWAQYFTNDGGRFASHPPTGTATANTAYATYLHPEVLLVTTDHFKRTKDNVIFELGSAQMDWFRSVLSKARSAGVDWIIVQGHNPVLRPVRERHSSGGRYLGGSDSEYWQVMEQYGVDLYLAGEVHDTAVKRHGQVTQISHGGLVKHGEAMYLTGSVSGATMTLQAKQWHAHSVTLVPPMWQTDTRKYHHMAAIYTPGPYVFGELVLRKNRTILSSSGGLTPGCC